MRKRNLGKDLIYSLQEVLNYVQGDKTGVRVTKAFKILTSSGEEVMITPLQKENPIKSEDTLTNEHEKLWDSIQTYSEIWCNSCGRVVFCEGDDYPACENFYKQGWRAGRQYAYCPECAKKKLKKKS